MWLMLSLMGNWAKGGDKFVNNNLEVRLQQNRKQIKVNKANKGTSLQSSTIWCIYKKNPSSSEKVEKKVNIAIKRILKFSERQNLIDHNPSRREFLVLV